MSRKIILSALAAMSAFAAFAASSVSDVVVRQRWPWSETVDIDYTLTGDKGDVTFSATWDGQTTPVVIGTDFQVEAGQHRFEWCPTNNYAGQTLTGFTVTAEAATFEDHKYIVLDLVNGGYTFMSAPPEGGWTDEHKSTKMVFARCPAGSNYQLGISNDDLAYVANGDQNASNYKTAMGLAKVTFTSDWYMGIFMITDAQYQRVKNGTISTTYSPRYVSYAGLRGNTNDTPAVNWPDTKFYVSPDSFIAKLRSLSGNSLCIDLPQESQWEVAVRAGASTFWSTGGTSADSLDQLTNYVQRIISYNFSTKTWTTTDVGCAEPNQWGIYDPVSGSNLALDTVALVGNKRYPSKAQAGGTNPIGASVAVGNYMGRVVRLSGSSLWERLPMGRYATFNRNSTTDPAGLANGSYYARLAIHLKPLNFGD